MQTCLLDVWSVSLVLKAFSEERCFFLMQISRQRKIILKLIKSGQRNVKNFSEIYKCAYLLKMKTVTSVASAWSLSWPSESPQFLPSYGVHTQCVLSPRHWEGDEVFMAAVWEKTPMYLAVSSIEVTTNPTNTWVWRQLHVQIVRKFTGGKLQLLRWPSQMTDPTGWVLSKVLLLWVKQWVQRHSRKVSLQSQAAKRQATAVLSSASRQCLSLYPV